MMAEASIRSLKKQEFFIPKYKGGNYFINTDKRKKEKKANKKERKK